MTDTVRVPREPTEAMLQGACDKHKPGQPMSEDRPEECPRFQTRRRIYRAMLAASPQEAVPTKREAALAELAKLDGETMDLAASPQGEGDWITHDGGPNPVPGKTVDVTLRSGEVLKNQDADGESWSHVWGQADIIATALPKE